MSTCKHVGKRGAAAGKACKNKATNGDYCRRHKKKVVDTDLTRDEVFGTAGAPAPATPAVKFRFSVWKWTVNTNRDLSKMSVEDKKRFKNAIEHIFGEEGVARYLVDSTHEEPTKNIAELKSQWYFEVGSEQHRLHTHGIVALKHTGNYRMAVENVRAVLNGILGGNVHFTATASGDATRAWEAYMEKAQGENVVKL